MLFDRRSMILSGVAMGLCGSARAQSLPGLPAPLPAALVPTGAKRSLYDQALVIDGLSGIGVFNIPYPPADGFSSRELQDARESGITAINYTIGDLGYAGSKRSIKQALRGISRHADTYLVVRSFEDLLRAKRERKVGLIFGFQDPSPIGKDLARLDTFAELGVRIFQLTYNNRSLFGDGCLVEENRGLTPLGREAVERLNNLNVVIDLSHAGPQTAFEGLTASAAPPVISHTGCRAVYDHPRSQTDEVLKACASKGGVAGMYLMPFLGLDPHYPSRDLLLRHIDHALNICGEDHVGIGSDMSISPVQVTKEYLRLAEKDVIDRRRRGIGAPLEELPVLTPELNTPRRLELIAEGMASRGHPDRVIEKVIGGNFGRVFREVWRA